MAVVQNCIFNDITTASKYGIYGTGSNGAVCFRANNSYYNVTTPESGLGDTGSFDDVLSGSSSNMSDPGSDNFTPGSGERGKASPGLFEGISFSSYGDIGASQHADPAGSGGIPQGIQAIEMGITA